MAPSSLLTFLVSAVATGSQFSQTNTNPSHCSAFQSLGAGRVRASSRILRHRLRCSEAQAAPRVSHVVLGVGDVATSGAFYGNCFGFKCDQQSNGGVALSTGQQDALSFHLQPCASTSLHGLGYKRMEISVEDLESTIQRVEASQGTVVQGPEAIIYPASMVPDEDVDKEVHEISAVVTDPDGYEIKLVQGSQLAMCQAVLSVVTMKTSVDWYSNVLGMRVVRFRANLPEEPSMSTWLTFGEPSGEEEEDHDEKLAPLHLHYEYDTSKLKPGDGYQHMVVSASDLSVLLPSNVTLDVSPEGQSTAIMTDPDGYSINFLESE